ncbi:MAG: SPOR domain-containing protein [candidate division KSB1 bacterium]|nr:SPOR domain-containing protein [candidate division KSB1 bacterium]
MSDRRGSETFETVPPGQKLLTVQVAATKNARAAQREVVRLKKAGYDAYLVYPKKRGGFYKIRVGKYTSKVAAEKAARTLLKKKLIREYFLVNYQPELTPRKNR